MAWVLMLNDMRSPKFEWLQPVCQAETKEELEEFLQREKVDLYHDGKWAKSFRQGGPLEWFNQPTWWDLSRNIVAYRPPPKPPSIPAPTPLTRWDRINEGKVI